MLVLKFGGASVKNAGAIRNVGEILKRFQGQKMVVVVSAMDKTTNQLDKLAQSARDNDENATRERFEKIRAFHQSMLDSLFGGGGEAVQKRMDQFFLEMKRIIDGVFLLQEFPPSTHDRIVSYGELLSSTLLFHHLRREGIAVDWLDARQVVVTDSQYTRANVIWSATKSAIETQVKPKFTNFDCLLTQGFIARNTAGKATTLGREGSDYTAAIFSNILNADRMIVWKDVSGVLNADPRIEENTVKLDGISYESAVEMTYYGATVIHPKTLKPLFVQKIPLNVRSFLDPESEGTWIPGPEGRESAELQPSVTSTIIKRDQVWVRISPKDFSFMDKDLMQEVFQDFAAEGLNLNLVQRTSISLHLVMDHRNRLRELENLLTDRFNVEMEKGLTLTTLLNYKETDWERVKGARLVQQVENKLFFLH